MLKNSFKMVSMRYLLKRWRIGFKFYTQVYNYKGQVRFRVKSTNYFWSYGPFSTLKNGFRSITFEKITELDSYFIYKHIIIKYRSSSI